MIVSSNLLFCVNCFIIIFVGLLCDAQFVGSGSGDLILYEGSDFLIAVTSSLFVDRSLHIKTLFDVTKRGCGLLIRTPPKYGKTTNINMIKRFLSVNVNEKGIIQDPKETSNYLLFKNNNLKVYSDKIFFNSHFGQYPVLSIDFNPLSEVCNFYDFLEVLKNILSRAAEGYGYNKNEVRCSDENVFNSTFADQILNYNQTQIDLQAGFYTLVKQLHKRFKRRVIILIDNFDAFVESPMYSKNSNIIGTMAAVFHGLLGCVSVERSLVTGVIRTSGPSVDVLPSCVVPSGAEHGVWRYYGLNGQELDSLLLPMIPDHEQREKVKENIVHEYNGLDVKTFDEGGDILNTQISSVWYVTQYLESEGANNNFDYIEYTLD